MGTHSRWPTRGVGAVNPEGWQMVAGGRSPFALNDHRNAAFEGKHPGSGARPAVAEPDRDWRSPIELWRPAGVREQSDAVFRWSFGAKRTTTGYLLSTLRVAGGWQQRPESRYGGLPPVYLKESNLWLNMQTRRFSQFALARVERAKLGGG